MPSFLTSWVPPCPFPSVILDPTSHAKRYSNLTQPGGRPGRDGPRLPRQNPPVPTFPKCLLLARLGPPGMSARCLLSEAKRSCIDLCRSEAIARFEGAQG